MQALHLFKYAESGDVEAGPQLRLQQGLGIEGDRHARWGSLRQVLLVSQSVLNNFDLKPGSLFENIVVSGDLAPFQSGDVLQIGETLIRLTIQCEPCSKLEQIRPGLTRQLRLQRGVLGRVIKGGTIAISNPIMPMPYRLPAIPSRVKDRFTEFVSRIPAGCVVPTSDLLLAIGVNRAYYRTIPQWIKTAADTLPIHRLVSPDGHLFCRHLPDQAEQLQRERVKLIADKVEAKFFWSPIHFYEETCSNWDS